MNRSSHERFKAEPEPRPIVVKVLAVDDPLIEARLRHELAPFESLELPGVARILGLERVDGRMHLELESRPGVDLEQLVSAGPLEVAAFLPIALALTTRLAALHERGLVHRDLRPTTIGVDEHTGEVWLGPPGLAYVLEQERRASRGGVELAAVLAYVAPEQLDGQRRTIDARSDLYSLGAVFHRLLAGRPPFLADSAFGLRRAHLGVAPRVLERVPSGLRAITSKLLGKAPGDRYRSATALLGDLQRFAAILASTPEPQLELGTDDRPQALMLPGRLYGREPSLRVLAGEFAAVIERGEVRIAVVVGAEGCGKSTLLESFESTVIGREGLLALGRFEARDGQPWSIYGAVVEALTHIAEQIAEQSPAAIEGWRSHLRARVGAIAPVLVELIPALAGAFGELAPIASLPTLEPEAARRRFELALFRLLAAIGERVPVVLALDDLHTADLDSLSLLEAVVRARTPALLLLACDPLALAAEGPVSALLERLRAEGHTPTMIELEPLRSRELAELLADTFACGPAESGHLDALVEVIERRTRGVPGRLRRGLEQLVERGAIGPSPLGWVWDLQAIERASLELDASAQLVRAREQLDAAELELLEAAARLGRRFDPAALVEATTLEPAAIVAGLARSTELGLISPHGLEFQFARDVRATALVAEGPAPTPEVVARAGARALMFGAWHTACAWFERVSSDSAELACDHAVALALARRYDEAEASFSALLARPLALDLYARVVVRRLHDLIRRGRTADALELGLTAMDRCGLRVGRRTGTLALVGALARGWWACRSLDLDEMCSAGPLDDPALAAALEIAAVTIDAAFAEEPRMYVRLAAARAERLAGSGIGRQTPHALVQFAVVLATGRRLPLEAARLAELAVDLCEQVDGEALRPRVTSFASRVVWPLTRPLSECVAELASDQRAALEVGDVALANFDACAGVGLSIHAGTPLPELRELGLRWSHEVQCWATPDYQPTLDAWLAIVSLLIDGDNHGSIARAGARVAWVFRSALVVHEALARWLLGQRDAAAELLEPLMDELGRLPLGSWHVPPGAVLIAIVAGENVDRDDPMAVAVARRRLGAALGLARRFARSSAANYGAHVELITAELERLAGRVEPALVAYERARERSVDAHNPCVAAIACVRLASLAAVAGRLTTARGAMVTAVSLLRCWGAEAAARALEHEHGELLASGAPNLSSAGASRADAGPAVDASTVLGITQSIGEELQIDEVITRIVTGAVTRAGDERASLLLEHAGRLGLVATGDGVELELFVDEPVSLAEARERVPVAVIEHARAGELVVIDDVRTDLRFAGDPYLQANELRSLLGIPITRQAERHGVLVIESRSESGAFSRERVELLRILLTQAASALWHARLYEALQRSEALFRSLVDGVPDMISLLDCSGRIEFINHLGGFGGDASLLIGADSRLLMDASCGPQWTAAIEYVATTGERRELEIRANLPGGNSRWFRVQIAAIEFAGKIGKLITISTDITERKLAESDRLRLEAQLRQQQRLESVGTLASGVAHEINNPIQGIMNYAELLGGRADDPALVREFAGEILHESERVATIVRNLLAFSRQEGERPPEGCTVEALIETSLSLIRAVVRKDGIELRVELPAGLDRLECRLQQIQQIIMNLVTNARDALNERHAEAGAIKLIEIRACNLERDGRRWVQISVQDHGTGIPEHVRARIFDPFFTTKGRDQGTGLGLAVSHGIAVDHGGELWVESELGVGSTFHLELPALGPH